jgi:DNA-binding transcriptional ArsR family regulator
LAGVLPLTLRNGCFLVLALLAVAPAASASILPKDPAGAAEGTACSDSTVKGVLDAASDSCADSAGDGSGGSGDGSSDDGSDGGSGSSSSQGRSAAEPVVSKARPVVAVAVKTVQDTVASLPEDPVGLALSQVEPVRHTAETLPGLILPPPEGKETPPAPATASVEEVAAPDAVPLLVAAGATAAAAAVALLWLAGSSGSLGAGAAGSAAAGTGKLGATDLRRLLPFASPLFTRFEKDTVLGHPKREALYALILQDPGVSLQHLCDATGLSRTAVTHHLRLLELQHLIVSKRMGRNRHYYENGGRFGRDQKDAYAVLQNGRSKEVAMFVKQNPGAIQKAVCAAVGVQASVAHWHLKRLQEAQLVEAVRSGRTVAYFPGPGLKALQGSPAAAAASAMALPAPPVPSVAPMPAAPSLPLSA